MSQIRIVRGDPSPEEIAVVTAVLLRCGQRLDEQPVAAVVALADWRRRGRGVTFDAPPNWRRRVS